MTVRGALAPAQTEGSRGLSEREGQVAASGERGWVTDRAWVCGVSGAASVVLLAILFHAADALEHGIVVFGARVTGSRLDTVLAALLITAGVMLGTELLRLWRRAPGQVVHIDPLLLDGKVARFCADSLLVYLLHLGLFWVAVRFYYTAGEYGYERHARHYRSWFRLLELMWTAYLWGGLPYVLGTRALKHDPHADQRDPAHFFSKLLTLPFSRLEPLRSIHIPLDEQDKKTARSLLVKLFFAPLMTVFFVEQFPHLVRNVGYVSSTIPERIAAHGYGHQTFNQDLFNVAIALFFSVDVALAFCGYVFTSRWVDNHVTSVEPTVLGWVVCLVCYPPFQRLLGVYYAAPSERAFLGIENQWAVSAFAFAMVCCYAVYVWATLVFGVRFSNLTHRGIIRAGPYAFVRHPAYASKNIAWWCVMFPAVLYGAAGGGGASVAGPVIGLVAMTSVYYLRAMTEERHLAADPRYADYCRKVKHRFIPGLL